jgi:predicted MPP superfamily phosphohydrolase
LMLSGHTHGGQIALPLYGPVVTSSRFGTKYARGLIQGPACPVFVSSGIGLSAIPLRTCLPPEIVVLQLRSGEA